MDDSIKEIERKKIIVDFTVLLLSLDVVNVSPGYFAEKLDVDKYISKPCSITYPLWIRIWGENENVKSILNYSDALSDVIKNGDVINIDLLMNLWETHISSIKDIIVDEYIRRLVLHSILKRKSEQIFDYPRELGLNMIMKRL